MTRISYSLGSFPTPSTTSAQLAPLHVNEQKVLFLRRQQRLVSEHLKEPVYTAVRTQRDLLVLGQADKQPVPQPTLGGQTAIFMVVQRNSAQKNVMLSSRLRSLEKDSLCRQAV